MALQIQTPIILNNGLELTTSYGRIDVQNFVEGSSINAILKIFISKEKFDNGFSSIYVEGLVDYINTPYNRLIDGVDILNIAHDAFIAKLAEQGIVATKDLD